MPIGTDTADFAVQADGTTQEASVTYCTVSDVRRTLRKAIPGANPGGDGQLTKQDWIDAILDAEAEVDRQTNNSWRPRRVELEYIDYEEWIDEENFMRVQLEHQPVQALNSGNGDVLEVWDGSTWVDFLATKTEGRDEDWWLQEPDGFLFIRRALFPRPFRLQRARVRVSYRYGQSQVPRDIRKATRLLAAADLATGDALVPGGFGGEVDRIQLDPKVTKWERKAAVLMAPHQKVGRGY